MSPKKFGHLIEKGAHLAEEVAASGALGPQAKAIAIAAAAAETGIKGAIKGKSPEQIAKETALKTASMATGGKSDMVMAAAGG